MFITAEKKIKEDKLVDLQHELHADSVLYQPHHQVGLALEHLVVLPGQGVRVLDGEVKVWGWTKGRETVSKGVIQWQPLHWNWVFTYLSFSLPPLKVGCNRTPPIFSSYSTILSNSWRGHFKVIGTVPSLMR